MKIEYSEVKDRGRQNIGSLEVGQCFVQGTHVFLRVGAIDGDPIMCGSEEVVAIRLDGFDLFDEGALVVNDVYEIESITLRRVK